MKRPNHPAVDRALHRPMSELMSAMADPHQHSLELKLIVLRKLTGARLCPQRARLSSEEGVIGDRWSLGSHPVRGEQVAVMEHRWLSLVANGQSLTLAGDNLVVDAPLHLAVAGQRVQLGEAVMEVSSEPHNGCSLFAKRFGAAALKWTLLPEHSSLKLRGIYCTVVEGGEVSIGDRWCWR